MSAPSSWIEPLESDTKDVNRSEFRRLAKRNQVKREIARIERRCSAGEFETMLQRQIERRLVNAKRFVRSNELGASLFELRQIYCWVGRTRTES